MKVFCTLILAICVLSSCRSQSKGLIFKNHIDKDCICKFSDLNYDLEPVERAIMFKLISSTSRKNQYKVFFDYINNNELVSSGTIDIEGDKLFFTKENSLERTLFFDFNFKLGQKWDVHYLGLLSNYTLTLIKKNSRKDIYKILLKRIGPISSHETILEEMYLTREGIKSMKIKTPGTGSEIECVFK